MLEELEKVKGEFTESKKINFCKSLTFLELGMTFKDESGKELNDDKKDTLIAGILANWCEEGFFQRQMPKIVRDIRALIIQMIMSMRLINM